MFTGHLNIADKEPFTFDGRAFCGDIDVTVFVSVRVTAILCTCSILRFA